MNDDRPTLAFFTSRSCGPGRRMESVLAQLANRERKRLRVMRVDVEEHAELAERFSISILPTLVLIERGRVVDRLEGGMSGSKIYGMLGEHLGGLWASPQLRLVSSG